jgi:hypothetical protein
VSTTPEQWLADAERHYTYAETLVNVNGLPPDHPLVVRALSRGHWAQEMSAITRFKQASEGDAE